MPLNIAVTEQVEELEIAVVAIGLPDDVILRAVDGVVGYCRSGLFAYRYILLVVPDDNGTWWGVEFSHPLKGEFEMEFTADFAEPWVDFKALLTTWDVDWCLPEVNDRALFLIFDPHMKDLPQSWHDRRLRALGAAPRVDLFTKPGAPIPIAVSPTYASALLRGGSGKRANEPTVEGTPQSPGARGPATGSLGPLNVRSTPSLFSFYRWALDLLWCRYHGKRPCPLLATLGAHFEPVSLKFD